jgi:hypothetical protein
MKSIRRKFNCLANNIDNMLLTTNKLCESLKMNKQQLKEYEQMIREDLEIHKTVTNCKCPFQCPVCSKGNCTWDMGAEGHFCSMCDYYDGLK